jgi:hypothetical protein
MVFMGFFNKNEKKVFWCYTFYILYEDISFKIKKMHH